MRTRQPVDLPVARPPCEYLPSDVPALDASSLNVMGLSAYTNNTDKALLLWRPEDGETVFYFQMHVEIFTQRESQELRIMCIR